MILWLPFVAFLSWVSYEGGNQVAMDCHLGKRLWRRAMTFLCGSIRAIQTLPVIILECSQSDAPQVLLIFVQLIVLRDHIWCCGRICTTKVSHWPGSMVSWWWTWLSCRRMWRSGRRHIHWGIRSRRGHREWIFRLIFGSWGLFAWSGICIAL